MMTGLMSSERQSSAILVTRPSKSGLASSTFFIHIDLGLLPGPVTGYGVIEQLGTVQLNPVLAIVLVLSLMIYLPLRGKIGSIH